MIAKEILKKHNLKAVPFSCIREGQTFNDEESFDFELFCEEWYFFTYLVRDGKVFFADSDEPELLDPVVFEDKTVYVPVWRPTNV